MLGDGGRVLRPTQMQDFAIDHLTSYDLFNFDSIVERMAQMALKCKTSWIFQMFIKEIIIS